ncbi:MULTISPECIES: hypothetical protein [unclassified Blastococcus]|uniref:hypothetical protein n=1 Tax=unclassified Blastococcus TaxID=2619396 RepID=UPI001EF029D5|nr:MULTISPECIES: hypothetical protein [unclassified Blastococcus]
MSSVTTRGSSPEGRARWRTSVDADLLAGLTKRRVRALADHLDVPQRIITKTPTADLEFRRPHCPVHRRDRPGFKQGQGSNATSRSVYQPSWTVVLLAGGHLLNLARRDSTHLPRRRHLILPFSGVVRQVYDPTRGESCGRAEPREPHPRPTREESETESYGRVCPTALTPTGFSSTVRNFDL